MSTGMLKLSQIYLKSCVLREIVDRQSEACPPSLSPVRHRLRLRRMPGGLRRGGRAYFTREKSSEAPQGQDK